MSRRLAASSFLALAAASVAFYVGCNNSGTGTPPAGGSAPPQEARATEAKKEAEHAHKPGAHGGTIVEIGRDNYHAEAVFEKGGVLRLYTLGSAWFSFEDGTRGSLEPGKLADHAVLSADYLTVAEDAMPRKRAEPSSRPR